MKTLAVVASSPGGSTDTLVRAVLEGTGGSVDVAYLGDGFPDLAAAAFDAMVLGTPTYRATYAGSLKEFLDRVPRGKPADGFPSPLLGVPVAVVAIGASDHHFLGADPLVSLLVRFFAAWVVPPTVYGVSSRLEEALPAARSLGEATAALAAVREGVLADRRPQV
jgi:FMN reductase